MALTISGIPKMSEFSQVDFDLSGYRDRLAQERGERTLQLRRSSFHNHHRIYSNPRKPSSWTNAHTALSPEWVVLNLRSNQSKQYELLLSLNELPSQFLATIASNDTVCDALCENLQNHENFNNNDINLFINLVSLLFVHTQDEKIRVDYADGLISTIGEFLEIPVLIKATINMIQVFAVNSNYACNSLTCFGIHITIVEIAKHTIDPSIAEDCMATIYSIFADSDREEETNAATVEETVNHLIELLSSKNEHILYLTMNTFIELSNARKCINDSLFQKGVCRIALQFLNHPTLWQVAIHLIGNICVSDYAQKSDFINGELINQMMSIMNKPEVIADVYWFFSKIIEAAPNIVTHFFNTDFIAITFQISDNGPLDVKKEAAFFLATFIKIATPEELGLVVNENLISLFDEMLCCGVDPIVLRMIDAINKIVLKLASDPIFTTIMNLFSEYEVYEHLLNLTEQENVLLAEHASSLSYKLEVIAQQQ